MNFFPSWDILGISLVLSLRFLGPFALGVSLIAWAVLRPPGYRTRLFSLLGIVLGVLTLLAPVFLFLVSDIFG